MSKLRVHKIALGIITFFYMECSSECIAIAIKARGHDNE